MQRLWNTICQYVVAPTQLSGDQFVRLLAPFGRSPQLRRHAATVIIARVQLICALFAVLVPLWAVVDFLVFDWPVAWRLALTRLASTAVFVALAWPRAMSPRRPYLQAMAMLVTMMLVPPLFYLASLQILDLAQLSGWPRLIGELYGFMPTVVLGGLAIFPLTALEALLLALPTLAMAVLGIAAGGLDFSLQQHGAALWFMLLMLGVAMFSGMSQTHYMESLVHKAMTDPLTGAFSRRSGAEALELMFRLSSMSARPLTVVFFDLDHFKAINDGYGHEAGDQALVDLVAALRATLRRGDVLARWGGEEFVLVLPEMSIAEVPAVLGRLRAKGLGLRPDGAPLTASIGVAESLTDEAADWTRLVDLADQRMYRAKREGRDCAVLPDGSVIGFSVPAGA